MKKLLLFLFGVVACLGTKAQTNPSDWTEESLAEFDASITANYSDVVYMKSCIFTAGSGEVQIPVNIKTHQDFNNIEFDLVLPENLMPKAKANNATSALVTATDPERIAAGSVDGKLNDGSTHFITSQLDFSPKGDGELFYITVDITDLPAGVYDMTIKGYEQRKFQGTIIAGFSDAYNDYVEIKDDIVTKLVISDEVILDENSEEYPGTYAGVNVKVLRTISANNWNTLCLPFNMSEEQCKEVFGDDVQLAEYTGYEYNEEKELINVRFTEISSITANRPCIIKVSNATDHENGFKVKNVDITPVDEEMEDGLTCGDDAGGMYGTYVNGTPLYTRVKVGKQWVETQYVFLSGNNFYYATADSKPMKGFRAYFWFEDEAITALADGVKFNFSVNDDEPTSIDGISTIEKVADGVYNVSGQKVSESSLEGLPKGVYIVNGKKVFKK